MYKYIFPLLLFLWSLYSCQDKKLESLEPQIVVIENFEHEMEIRDFTSSVRVVHLHTDTAGYIGQIKDICAIDSFLYVWDGARMSLSQFRRADGLWLRSVHAQGNGPMEYIQPVSLTSDDSRVYLLDMPGMSIIAYDKNLHGEKEIPLTFPCLDFVRLPEGFLCYNIAPTETLKQMVYINTKGEVKASFQLTKEMEMPVASGAKIFTKDKEGNIFINPPFSRNIYTWNADKTKIEIGKTFDFKQKNIPEKIDISKVNLFEESYAIPSNFFQTGNSCLYSYIYRQKRYYTLISLSGEVSGYFTEKSTYPFFPQWQIENNLIGTCPAEFLPSSYQEEGEVLLWYTIK